MNKKLSIVFALLFSFVIPQGASAMFGGGYIVAGAYGGVSTVLMDSSAKVVFTWDHSKLTDAQGRLNGYSSYLLPNGNLLRSAIVPEGTVVSSMAPRQGIIQEIDRNNNIVWRYQLANDSFMLHHDMKYMPNGHVLAVTFVTQTKPQMVATGVDTGLLKGIVGANKFILSEKIIEIDPKADGGPKIVWEWKMYDHVIRGDSAAAHPELISGTISPALFYTNQWVHLNSLDYNAKLDLILFSSRVFSELYIIDHGTTTAQAMGHTGGTRGKGGDLLFRWGHPANYKMTGGTTLNVMHGCNWIPESFPGGGDIIFFHNNNATSTTGKTLQSQVVEVKPPMDASGNFQFTAGQAFGPAQPTWVFAPTDSFSSSMMSCAFRLPNGNSLALLAYPFSNVSANSLLVEVDNNQKVLSKVTMTLKGEKVEKGNSSIYNPAKIMFYEKTYAGIEALFSKSGIRGKTSFASNGPSLSKAGIRQTAGGLEFSNVAGSRIDLFNMQGKKVFSSTPGRDALRFETCRTPPGLYCVKISHSDRLVDLQIVNIAK